MYYMHIYVQRRALRRSKVKRDFFDKGTKLAVSRDRESNFECAPIKRSVRQKIFD